MTEVTAFAQEAEIDASGGDVPALILAELKTLNSKVDEFISLANEIGKIFDSGDGKPVSPMALISGALFGKK